jgi:hypothetical protein
MKKLKFILKYYGIGFVASLLLIGLIHLYNYIIEPYFIYAKWYNILITALISGTPFGLAAWAVLTINDSECENDKK